MSARSRRHPVVVALGCLCGLGLLACGERAPIALDLGATHDLAAGRDDVPRDSLAREPARSDLGCAPSFSIPKAECPYHSGKTPCPAGQLCQDYFTCVPIGCSSGPECTAESEPHFLTVSASASTPPTSLAGVISKKTATSLEVKGAEGTVVITADLPAELALPVSVGDPLTLTLCYSGTPINGSYEVVARDASGALLFFGGRQLKSACTPPGLTLSEALLDCAPRQTSPPDAAAVASFALRFQAGSAEVVVPQRGRGELSLDGRTYRVATFTAAHLLEWTGTDVFGPFVRFAVVRSAP